MSAETLALMEAAMVADATTNNEYDFRIQGAIRGRADRLIIDADRVEFDTTRATRGGDRPTDDELRRVIDDNLASYRRGLAERNQGGGTTSMSGWKIALIILVLLPIVVVAFFALYPTETRNFLGAAWARAVSATCIPPAPYATFDGIHKSGDSKWRVPVDDCPD